VIDIGASDGRWSGVCAKHYPDAHYLLIEAQDLHEEALKAYVSAHPKAQYQRNERGAVDTIIFHQPNGTFLARRISA
jgi:FkbM family methyltransferase